MKSGKKPTVVRFVPQPPPRQPLNIGAALARVRRETLTADTKHWRENGSHTLTAWLDVVRKQCEDLSGAVEAKDMKAVRKELTQVGAAVTLALAQLFNEGE